MRAIRADTGIQVGHVRAVAPNYTLFAVDSLNWTGSGLARCASSSMAPRLANVLRLLAERGGWGQGGWRRTSASAWRASARRTRSRRRAPRSQVEGSLPFGSSNALKERATVAGGAIAQSNFHDYQVLRMNEVPAPVEVHVVQSTEFPTGVGEPGATTIAPALSNAIVAATGARVRSVPLLPERVLAAIKQKV